MSALFDTSEHLAGTTHWRPARDGDPIGLALHQRHYSGWRRAGNTKGGHGREQLVLLERKRVA